MNTIKYIAPDNRARPCQPDNCTEVMNFVGEQPECKVCGGSGEYESEYGPKGCNPCNSRLVPFVDHSGKTVYADWGDTIERHGDGLHLVSSENAKEHLPR